MAKADTETPKALTPSWDFVKPSFNLIRAHADTFLWLVILPAVVAVLASQLISNIIAKYRDTLSSQPTDQEATDIIHKIAHELLHTSHGHIALALLVFGTLWQLVIYPATVSFMVRAVKDEPADIKSSLRGGFGYFWQTIGITICMGLIILLGLCLFIVPGFIFARRYILAPFYGMDKQTGVFEALRLSAADSAHYKGYIWGTAGVYLAFAIIGSVAGVIPVFGVVAGLVFNYVYYFGFALRYGSIVGAHSSTRTKK